jgi:hypothetical protein
MAGIRKVRSTGVGDADTRITVLVPREIARQLRALAAARGSPVAPIVRTWITEKLAAAIDQEKEA